MQPIKKRHALHGHSLVIELDATEIFPSDPGAGTPAMVYDRSHKHSGTFHCVLDTGELLSTHSGYKALTPAQSLWLDSQESFVNQWVESRSTMIQSLGRDAALSAMS